MATSQPSPDSNDRAPSFPIVGIGASAGAVQALKRFFSSVSEDSGMAYVVLVHLVSEQRDSLPDILQRYSPIQVHWATNGDRLRPNEVYLIPSQSRVEITPTEIKLTSVPPQEVLFGVDSFFHSLGENQGDRAVGVILSGMGNDGTLGIKTIKDQE